MGELHHLVAELAENLDEFLEGADSFQMLQGNQDLVVGGKRIGSASGAIPEQNAFFSRTLKGHGSPPPAWIHDRE